MSNILLTDVQILTSDTLLGSSIVPEDAPKKSILLTDVEIPVHDNLLETEVSLNDASPSNSDILPTYTSVDELSPIPPGTGSVFPTNPSELPNTETLQELLSNLSEVMIRFNTSPGYYQKDDYRILINTITNSLIHLYLSEQAVNSTAIAIPFIGIAYTDTNPVQDALDRNNRFPGIYFAQDAGTYTGFDLSVSSLELQGSVVLLLPNISNNTFVNYQKQVYTIDLSAIVQDKYFRYTQNTPSASWNITHNLNKYPSVIVTTSAGSVVEGEVIYIDNNNVQINFSAGFSGYADFN